MSTKKTTAAAPAKPAAKQKLDLRQLQAQQLSGEDIEQAKGSEDDSYSFPAHESDRIHVELVKKENDPVAKEYVTRKKTVKLYPAEFERMEKNGSFDEYDSQTVLHDPRKAGATKTAAPAASGTKKEPMQPVEGLPTLQDAQMRYQELYGEKAPADKTYEQLVELIQAKGSDADAEGDDTNGENQDAE